MTDQYRYDPKARRASAILATTPFDDVINGNGTRNLDAGRAAQPRVRDGQPTGPNLDWRRISRVVFAIGLLVYALSKGRLGDALDWLLQFLN